MKNRSETQHIFNNFFYAFKIVDSNANCDKMQYFTILSVNELEKLSILQLHCIFINAVKFGSIYNACTQLIHM